MGSLCITDVTLREHGQNLASADLPAFSPKVRARMARGLIQAGVRSLEVFSCVHPRLAPAMARPLLEETAAALGRQEGIRLITLVPNRRGYATFLELGLGPEGYGHTLGVFFSAVEAHNRANLGESVAETLKGYRVILEDARRRGIPFIGYLSAAFGYRDRDGTCLFPAWPTLTGYLDFYLERGAEAVVLSDLQGVADRQRTQELFLQILERRVEPERLGYHPHDTVPARAIEKSLALHALGIRRFDAGLGGTGGCITGAPGNQPTEGLVEAFEQQGIPTGIALGALPRAVRGEET